MELLESEEESFYEDEYDTGEGIDHENYKGIYFEDEPKQKFQDEVTGAHFEFNDMCKRLG